MDRVEVVHEVEITQLATNYIGIWQETVAQWVALQPIFEVCAGKTGYWGGGHRRKNVCVPSTFHSITAKGTNSLGR